VTDFKERRSLSNSGTESSSSGVGVGNSNTNGFSGTRTTLRFLFSTSNLFTDQFTLRLRTQGRLLALPVTLGFFTHRSTDRLRRNTGSVAFSRSTDSFTLRTVSLFTQVLRAADVALRLFTVNSALSARGLFTLHLALRSFTDRVALSRADRIITLPSAFRMAAISSSDSEDGEESKSNEDSFHF